MAQKTEEDVAVQKMDKISLNNMVISLRPIVVQSKVHSIHKLSAAIKILRTKKTKTDIEKERNEKKVKRLVQEILLMKQAQRDTSAKFALTCEMTMEDVTRQENKCGKIDLEMRTLVRIAEFKHIRSRVLDFRSRFPDWRTEIPALLAVLGKNRKKKKQQKNSAIGPKNKLAEKAAIKVEKKGKKLEKDDPNQFGRNDGNIASSLHPNNDETKDSHNEDIDDIGVKNEDAEFGGVGSPREDDDDSSSGDEVPGDEDASDDDEAGSSDDDEGDDAFFVSTLKSALASSGSSTRRQGREEAASKVPDKRLNKKKGSMVVKILNLKGENKESLDSSEEESDNESKQSDEDHQPTASESDSDEDDEAKTTIGGEQAVKKRSSFFLGGEEEEQDSSDGLEEEEDAEIRPLRDSFHARRGQGTREDYRGQHRNGRGHEHRGRGRGRAAFDNFRGRGGGRGFHRVRTELNGRGRGHVRGRGAYPNMGSEGRNAGHPMKRSATGSRGFSKRPRFDNYKADKSTSAMQQPSAETLKSSFVAKPADNKPIHPSWAAKQQQKKAAILPFQGKKVVFGDDD